MVRPFLRARATIFTAMAAALVASAAQAADMPFPVETPTPVNEGPVEWGSNWYLRGQVGAADHNISTVDGMRLSTSWPSNWTIGLGGGYQFTNWLRADATVDYQELWDRNGLQFGQPCVGMDIYGPGGIVVNAPYPAICTPGVKNRAESISFMANAYLDLGNWWGFTPYVGAGVGANLFIQRHNVMWSPAFYPYVNFPPATGVSSDYLRFAYAGMAGVSYDIDSHWKIDLGYRFINLGQLQGFDIYNQRISRDMTSHQLRLGFRYVID